MLNNWDQTEYGKTATVKEQQTGADPESRVTQMGNGLGQLEQFKKIVNTDDDHQQASQGIGDGMKIVYFLNENDVRKSDQRVNPNQ